jgi:DNA invertase Pin-like site-specific DNA recombinase
MKNLILLEHDILSIIAFNEKQKHSRRTLFGLEKAKAEGKRFGSPQNLSDTSRKRSIESRKKKKLECNNWINVIPIITELRSNGVGLLKIAEYLNEHGYKTRNNKSFTPTTVQRLIKDIDIHNCTED